MATELENKWMSVANQLAEALRRCEQVINDAGKEDPGQWCWAAINADEGEQAREALAAFATQQAAPSAPTTREWMPLLGTPFAVRMDALDEKQAQRNHGGQTLSRLAERGGLGMSEASAIAERRQWRSQKADEAAKAIAAVAPQVAPSEQLAPLLATLPDGRPAVIPLAEQPAQDGRAAFESDKGETNGRNDGLRSALHGRVYLGDRAYGALVDSLFASDDVMSLNAELGLTMDQLVRLVQATHAALASQPAARVALTDEQIEDAYEVAANSLRAWNALSGPRGQQTLPQDSWAWHFTRAIEAAHGIATAGGEGV